MIDLKRFGFARKKEGWLLKTSRLVPIVAGGIGGFSLLVGLLFALPASGASVGTRWGMLAFFGGMGLLLLRMGFYPSKTVIDFERRAFRFRNVWGKTSVLAFNQVVSIMPVSLKLNGAPLGMHFRAVPIGATMGQQPISPTFRDNELAAEFGVVMFAEITKNPNVITLSEWMRNPE